MDCQICARAGDGARHVGVVGGNIYEDQWWYAYHAPPAQATLGQMFLVSKRHVLDFAEMTPDEAASYGTVLRMLIAVLKQVVDAARVYTVTTIEGVPHFHTWLVPRPKTAALRGWAFVASERTCSDADALEVSRQLRRLVTRDRIKPSGHPGPMLPG
jgi:diadenosine tetraphosphate (Ap4A) HIT family hydrolase